MPQSLEEIRKKIDSLDDRIHDLLMERADLIVDVSECKKKNNIPVVQPAREAVMIRRLLARHRGPLPEAAIVGIWRELVGAVSLLQTGLKVTVSQGEGHGFCWDMAKNYFGSILPMTRALSPVLAISGLRDNSSSFAVLPWPVDGEAAPWWPFLLSEDVEKMRVVCALPYGTDTPLSSTMLSRALVVAKTDYAASGEDVTFVIVQIDGSVSRGRVFDSFKDAGFEPLSLISRLVNAAGASNLHLLEIAGYVLEEDARLEALKTKFSQQNIKIFFVGGYPVPPIFKSSAFKKS